MLPRHVCQHLLAFSLTRLKLEHLSLISNNITNASLLVIAHHLQQLTKLVLDRCGQITVTELQQLKELPRLQEFSTELLHLQMRRTSQLG